MTDTVLGDFNRNGHVDTSDILPMEQALTNLSGYQTAEGLTNSQLLAIGDVNSDGKIDNTDVQSLINLVANNAASGGSGLLTAVPEPATIVLLGLGALAIAFRRLTTVVKHLFRCMDSGTEKRLRGVSETECGRFDCRVRR